MSEQTAIHRQGIVLGLPLCGRPVAPEWALALQSLGIPANMNMTICALKGEEVGEARCKIAKEALRLNAKYLFFLDDDTAPPYFALRKLVYALEQNALKDDKFMVAGGIYANKHSYPAEPMVFQEDGDGPFWNWKAGQVFECGSIGTGCMLIRTEVFRHLEEPWFKTVNESNFDPSSDLRRLEITDDLYFCKKVREAGFRLLADGGVLCVHWDVFSCACGCGEVSHPITSPNRKCNLCNNCEGYRMAGRPFLLPEDSYPFQKEPPSLIAVA